MSRWLRLIPALAVGLLLAACGEQGSDTPFAAPTPVFDGGHTAGGNLAGGGEGTTTTSSNTTTPSDSTISGGHTAGGN